MYCNRRLSEKLIKKFVVFSFSLEKKDIDSPTWPKKRSGGQPHKRKGDVFKSIGRQDPNFTVRRMEVHMMEELEKIQIVKKVSNVYRYMDIPFYVTIAQSCFLMIQSWHWFSLYMYYWYYHFIVL